MDTKETESVVASSTEKLNEIHEKIAKEIVSILIRDFESFNKMNSGDQTIIFAALIKFYKESGMTEKEVSEQFNSLYMNHLAKDMKPVAFQNLFRRAYCITNGIEYFKPEFTHNRVLNEQEALKFYDNQYVFIQGGEKAFAFTKNEYLKDKKEEYSRSKLNLSDGKEMYLSLPLIEYKTVGKELKAVESNSFEYWWKNTEQRYSGIKFDPREITPKNEYSIGVNKSLKQYNIWEGFQYEPSETGSCDKFIAYIKEVLCSNDEEVYTFVMNWIADMIQRPTNRPGVVLALRGAQGAGKTTLGYVLGKLYGKAHLLVQNINQLTARFNGQLAGKILISGEETIWGGDRAAESYLKTLITEDVMQIEEKNKAQYTIQNYMHFIFTSNSEWMAPVGTRDRRYCVLDVSDKYIRDEKYWDALHNELDNGGYEKLLYVLLHWDLSKANFKEIPDTQARRENIEEGLTPVQKWVYSSLLDYDNEDVDCNLLWYKGKKFGLNIPMSVAYTTFKVWAESNGLNIQYITMNNLTKSLENMFGKIKSRRRIEGNPQHVYVLPEVEMAKELFIKYTGITFQSEEIVELVVQ